MKPRSLRRYYPPKYRATVLFTGVPRGGTVILKLRKRLIYSQTAVSDKIQPSAIVPRREYTLVYETPQKWRHLYQLYITHKRVYVCFTFSDSYGDPYAEDYPPYVSSSSTEENTHRTVYCIQSLNKTKLDFPDP